MADPMLTVSPWAPSYAILGTLHVTVMGRPGTSTQRPHCSEMLLFVDSSTMSVIYLYHHPLYHLMITQHPAAVYAIQRATIHGHWVDIGRIGEAAGLLFYNAVPCRLSGALRLNFVPNHVLIIEED